MVHKDKLFKVVGFWVMLVTNVILPIFIGAFLYVTTGRESFGWLSWMGLFLLFLPVTLYLGFSTDWDHLSSPNPKPQPKADPKPTSAVE